MSACHLGTKQVATQHSEMFSLISPQIKFSEGVGVGGLVFKGESMLQKFHYNFNLSFGLKDEIFFKRGEGGGCRPL